jgi:Ca-activated chloride channel family protein
VQFASARATEGAKSAAYRAIAAIYEDGGTNLSGGLIAGREQVQQNPESGAVARVVLISDGLANEGLVARERLAALATETARRGVSITTVGVGLDFDEQTMTRIAVSGRGNYYFAENSFALAELFGRELDKLAATTATDVRLSIVPTSGVEIVEVYGYPMQSEGGRIIVPVADMRSGETRKVVLRLRIGAQRAGAIEVAGVGVMFRPTGSLETRTVKTWARAVVTERNEEVLAGRDRGAIRHIERARTAKMINEATAQYESGDAAAAMQMLRRQAAQTKSLAKALGDEELAQEIEEVAGSAGSGFAAAPAKPGSNAGKRASKASRKSAYDLMY